MCSEGRPSGEAYIELENDSDAAKAIKMDREVLQGRYIELFKSTADEMEYVLEKAERQANQPWDNVIRLRGIPFKVSYGPRKMALLFIRHPFRIHFGSKKFRKKNLKKQF